MSEKPPSGRTAKKALRKPKAGSAIAQGAKRGAAIADVDTGAVVRVMDELGGSGDSDYHPGRFYDSAGNERRSAYLGLHESIDNFHRLVRAGLERFDLSKGERLELDIAAGKKGMSERLLLSNGKIRRKAGNLLIKLLRRHFLNELDDARRWRFVTVISDEGNGLEYAPELSPKAFQKDVYRLLNEAGVSGIYVLEIQALNNFPHGGHGRTLSLHAHGLIWHDDPAFSWKDALSTMRKSPRLRSVFDAPTVHFRGLSDVKDIEWRAHYLSKAPFMGKNVVPSSVPGRAYEFKHYPVREDFAVRLFEVLSHFEVTDVVWGIRAGTAVRREWLAALKEWHAGELRRLRRHILYRDFDMADMWGRIHRRNPKKKVRIPVSIATNKPTFPTAWDEAAQARMAKDLQVGITTV